MAKQRRRNSVQPGEHVPVELESVPPEGQLIVRWLMEPTGILAHWGKKASVACPGPETCPTSLHRSRTFWKGFAAVEYWRGGNFQDWAPAVLEVTERLRELLEGHELRGQVWRLQRQVGRGGQREVTGEVVEQVNADYLRPAFAIEPVVFRVFRTTDILFGVAPPLPPRLILPPSDGPRPAIVAPRPEQQSPQPIRLRERAEAMVRAGKVDPGILDTLIGGVAASTKEPAGPASRLPGVASVPPSTGRQGSEPAAPPSTQRPGPQPVPYNPALTPSTNGVHK